MTDSQRAAFEQFWPVYGLDLDEGPIDFAALFQRSAPTVVEIGFGMGDSLLEMCKTDPDTNFIGIEVHPPGVGRLINEAGKRDLTNLRVYMADAGDVLRECIPDRSLSRIQIYFPDPWPKKKHHKRRIVQPELLGLCNRKLTLGGLLHLATDWEPYAEWMLEALAQVPQLESTTETGLSPRPEWRPETKFEKRGFGLGHNVHDLIYKRVS